MDPLTIRNYQPADLVALVQLINAADRVDGAGFATTVPTLQHRLSNPEEKPAQNLFVAELHGELVGYVMLNVLTDPLQGRFYAMGIVHPGWRRRGVGTALMKRAEERARQFRADKPLLLDMSVRERVTGAAELAVSLGLQPVRYFFYMKCHDLQHLPKPTLPAGFFMRRYIVGQDEPAFVAAYNDGFSDHWGSVPISLEKEKHRLAAPGFRAEDNLLVVDAQGRIAGVCIVLVPQMEPDLLEVNPPLIDDLAVPRAYRRRGIGRALLLAGMHRIRDLGFSAAALAVDADNPNKALGLYESAGFTVKSRSTAYRKALV